MPVYAREGVEHLWLVDPLARTVELYRREGAAWLVVATHAGEERVRIEPFEALELDLARWWLEAAAA
jgi:Uma2 family endonuclease